MTYNPPTETNPPFTSPVTWPFPTSALWWEADYRLRLLEAAVIFTWTSGTPGAAYVAVANTPPNPNVPTIAPPEGFLWVDLSSNPTIPSAAPTGPAGGDLGGTYPNPQVDMAIPAPLTSGSAILQFIDSLGDTWIAKNGVYGGAWKRPIDAIHARAYRLGALSLSGSGPSNYNPDTVAAGEDPYTLFNLATGVFTAPMTGLYMCTCRAGFTPVSGSWCTALISRNGASAAAGPTSQASSTNGVGCGIAIAQRLSTNDQLTFQLNGTAMALNPSQTGSWFTVDYMGTG